MAGQLRPSTSPLIAGAFSTFIGFGNIFIDFGNRCPSFAYYLSIPSTINHESLQIMSQKTFFITGANSGFGFAIASAAVQGPQSIGTVRSETSRTALAEAFRRSSQSSAT